MGTPRFTFEMCAYNVHFGPAIRHRYTPPMDTRKLNLFVRQVQLQCKFALRARKDLATSLRFQGDTTWAFYHIQSLLNASANISKLLDPKNERAPLRVALQVDEESILVSSEIRDMRNNYEHFDERIDRWWNRSKGETFIDLLLGEFPFTYSSEDVKVFRAYDDGMDRVLFWGTNIPLPELMDEISRLYARTVEIIGSVSPEL